MSLQLESAVRRNSLTYQFGLVVFIKQLHSNFGLLVMISWIVTFIEKVTVLWIVTILGMVTILVMVIIISDGDHHKGW